MSITRILLIVRSKEKTRVRSKEKTRKEKICKEKICKEKTPEGENSRTPSFRNANPELFIENPELLIENPELPSCESPESTRYIHKYSHSVP